MATQPTAAWLAVALALGLVRPGFAQTQAPPPAADVANQTVFQETADKISKDPAFRARIAERVASFLKDRGFADPKAAAKKNYWASIQNELQAALDSGKVDSTGAAQIYGVLGDAGDASDERKGLIDRLAAHEYLKNLYGGLKDPGSAPSWLEAFLIDAAKASRSILEQYRLDKAKIAARDQTAAAPVVPPGSSSPLGGAGWNVIAGDEHMYEGPYEMKFDGGKRTISPRVYARSDGNGGIKYTLEFWDISDPHNPRGRDIPLDSLGTTPLSITGADGTKYTYTVEMQSYSHASANNGKGDGTPWDRDTIVRLHAIGDDGSVQTQTAWLKYIVAERADQAWADGRRLSLGQARYMVSAQGGVGSGYALYDPEVLKAFEAGKLDPMDCLPVAAVATTKRASNGSGGGAPVGQRVPIIGTDYDLVYDPQAQLWSPEPHDASAVPPPLPPSASTVPSAGNPPSDGSDPAANAPANASAASTPSGKGWPDTYTDASGWQWSQNDVNKQLDKLGVPYRIYEHDDVRDGQDNYTYTALALIGGVPAPMKTMTIHDPKGNTGQVPAYCCGSAAAEEGHYHPGDLDIVGGLLVHGVQGGKKTLVGVEDPFAPIGTWSEGVATVSDRRHVRDVIAMVKDPQGPPAAVAAAMDKKIAELGGAFVSMRAMQSEDGWNYFVKTTNNSRFEKGHFWGNLSSAASGGGKAPPASGGGGTAAAPPPKKEMQYSTDDAGAPSADPFPADDKLGSGTGAVAMHRKTLGPSKAWAVYAADDGACIVRWNVMDSAGKPLALRTFMVYGMVLENAGNPCQNPDKYDIRPIKLTGPLQDMSGHWQDGKFGIWNRKTSENDKDDASGFVDFVILPK